MRFVLLLFFFLYSSLNYAPSLKPNAPERYLIQPGESLWRENLLITHPVPVPQNALVVRSMRAVYLYNSVATP